MDDDDVNYLLPDYGRVDLLAVDRVHGEERVHLIRGHRVGQPQVLGPGELGEGEDSLG